MRSVLFLAPEFFSCLGSYFRLEGFSTGGPGAGGQPVLSTVTSPYSIYSVLCPPSSILYQQYIPAPQDQFVNPKI